MKKFFNRVFIDGLSGMALGLFATLIVGTIIQQIGSLVGGTAGDMIFLIGKVAAALTGAGIGVGVCCKFKASPLVTVSAGVAGMVGAFASKLLATINPEHPIWDSQVLRFLDKKIEDTPDRQEKIRRCVALYAQIEQEIGAFILTPQGQECIALFDRVFPDCKDFSNFKKIDFYLWNLGKE